MFCSSSSQELARQMNAHGPALGFQSFFRTLLLLFTSFPMTVSPLSTILSFVSLCELGHLCASCLLAQRPFYTRLFSETSFRFSLQSHISQCVYNEDALLSCVITQKSFSQWSRSSRGTEHSTHCGHSMQWAFVLSHFCPALFPQM